MANAAHTAEDEVKTAEATHSGRQMASENDSSPGSKPWFVYPLLATAVRDLSLVLHAKQAA